MSCCRPKENKDPEKKVEVELAPDIAAEYIKLQAVASNALELHPPLDLCDEDMPGLLQLSQIFAENEETGCFCNMHDDLLRLVSRPLPRMN